jgi:glycerol-3-phosphate acyltransferase PlsY
VPLNSPTAVLALWFLIGFLCGSIPFGWVATRLAGVDIRTLGSGNIGATNVWRNLGWKYGLPVLLLDALKGFVPVLGSFRMQLPVTAEQQATFMREIYEQSFYAPFAADPTDLTPLYLPMVTGFGAILGHTFTPWLRFKGGKGIATGLGVLCALYGWWTLVVVAVFALTLAASRTVSLSSILAASTVTMLTFALPQFRHLWLFGTLAVALVIWAHRSNIRRIADGTESRVGRGNNTTAAESTIDTTSA